jgi:hypothetical protein
VMRISEMDLRRSHFISQTPTNSNGKAHAACRNHRDFWIAISWRRKKLWGVSGRAYTQTVRYFGTRPTPKPAKCLAFNAIISAR